MLGYLTSDILQADTHLPHELVWNPKLAQFRSKWTKFEGALYGQSPFRGPPSDAVDEQWNRYTTNPWIDGTAVLLSVSRADIDKAWKSSDDDWFNSTVELGEANGGGYMGTLEVFHQLHCLVSNHAEEVSEVKLC